jgi:putative transposase
MNKPEFLEGEIYHVYNRGVEKRRVFMDDKDYLRFIHDLFEFNDENPVQSSNVRLNTRKPTEAREEDTSQCLEVQLPNMERRKRKKLVEIHAFCLMPNHYHLLMRQRVENGIVRFMQKIGGYTLYFNERHERVGSLFQGRFKAVQVTEEAHNLHIPNYIHLNPLGMYMNAREEGKLNIENALEFLRNYRWSSFRDYIGIKNFPSIIEQKYLADIFGKPEMYAKEIKDWIREKSFNEPDEFFADENF